LIEKARNAQQYGTVKEVGKDGAAAVKKATTSRLEKDVKKGRGTRD
jgi:hypothetical protein